jgi:hypothetical protein
MKKSVARQLMEHHPAAYMRLAAHVLAFPCLSRSKAQVSGHAIELALKRWQGWLSTTGVALVRPFIPPVNCQLLPYAVFMW